MNFTLNFRLREMVKRMNLIRSLRKIMAYTLIFSLLWQNCLWAGYGLSTLEEELGVARARTYGGRRIGLVEPGAIRDNEIHNVFEDLQLLEEGGLVFKGAPETSKIYNRIYNADPIQLSGVIEADYPLPMVFANPGGLVLENPDFQNIHDLTLAAGALAQTNEGMAYGVENGSITINKTFVQEGNDLKNLSLAGRGIHIHQSFLSPSESLVLRAGQHVKGWKNGEEWISEDDLGLEESHPVAQNSIHLDDASILRSKGLFLESLDTGTAIHAKGLLQSTSEDIIIRAKGDVYIDKLFAYRNLKIKTTGKVFLKDQSFVGGSVKIKAAEIINQGKLIGTGNIAFHAPCRNEGFIKTQGIFDAKNFVNMACGRLEAKSVSDPLALLSRNLGSIELQDDLKLTATAETLKGTIKTQGKVEVEGQELTLDGNICARNGFDFKDLKKLINKRNSTLSAFGAGFQGKLEILENEGKIDLSSANAWIGRNKNQKTGIIRTRGHSVLEGDHYYNHGTVFTCGIQQTTVKGTYEDNGTVYAPTLFLLNAKTIQYTNPHKSFLKDAVVSATSQFNVGENVSFTLKGNQHPCFLQLSSQGDLTYKGQVKQFSSSSTDFPLLEYFKLFGQTPPSYADFFREVSSLSLGPWKARRSSLKSGITLQADQNINCNCKTAIINPENGFVNLFANGQILIDQAQIKAGYFKGNNAAIQSKTAILKRAELTSLFGEVSLFAKDCATLNHSTVWGSSSASIISQDIAMDGSTVKSTHGPTIAHGNGFVNINNSSVQGQSQVSIKGRDIAANSSTIKSDTGGTHLEATKSASINHSLLQAKSLVSLMGEFISVRSSHLESKEGSAQLQATHSATINNSYIQAKSFVSLMADYITFHSSKARSEEDCVHLEAKKRAEIKNGYLDGSKGVAVTASNLSIKESQLISLKGTGNLQAESMTLEDLLVEAKKDASIITSDLMMNTTRMKSEEGSSTVDITQTANITDSEILARFLALINAQDIFFDSSTLISQEDKVQFVAQKQAEIKDSDFNGEKGVSITSPNLTLHTGHVQSPAGESLILSESATIDDLRMEGKRAATISASDIEMGKTHISSSEGSSTVQTTNTVNITDSVILARLLALVRGKDVSSHSSSIISQEDSAQLQATHTASITDAAIFARLLAAITGKDVSFSSSTLTSKKDLALVAATNSATVLQSILTGQQTVVGGGKNLTLSQTHWDGLENNLKADNINADSNEGNGNTLFEAKEKLSINGLQVEGAVATSASTTTFSGNLVVDSLQAQGKHIKIDGDLFVKKILHVLAERIEQLGTTKAGEYSHIEATQQYTDTPESRNEAGGNLSLYASETSGFEGYQKAGDTLEIKLKDMNLLDLLNQTEARVTKAHLTEEEISFDEDFILDRTLHLWAKSLENKAKFTATNDFIAHMQTLIMNEGSMVIQGKLGLESQGVLANFGLMEATDIDAKAKTVVVESPIERKKIRGGYKDELKSEAIMCARSGNLKVEATDSLSARGVKFEAKLNVDLKSAGKLYLGAQQLESDVSSSAKRFSYHRYALTNQKTQVNAGKNVDMGSGEGMVFEGLDVRASGYVHAKSNGTLENKAVHNIVQEESHKESKGGMLRDKKKKDVQTTADVVVRNNTKAGEDVLLESKKDNLQQAPHIESVGPVSIISEEGRVYIKADKSSYMTSTQKSAKSLVWQSQQQKGRYNETIEMLEILAGGGIHIAGAQGVEAEIKGGKTLPRALDDLGKHAETTWVKELRNNPKVTWHRIAEEHKKHKKKSQGLTAPAAAVIALAVAIATQGAGAALIAGLTTNVTAGAMASAGLTSIVSQASLSLINHQGNLSKVLKDMGSKDNLRSLATSIAAAGIVQGVSTHFQMPSQATTFTEHLQKNALSSGTSAGLTILVQKQDITEALLQGAVNTAVDTAAGMGANNIATNRESGVFNAVTQKLAHGVLGAATSTTKAALLDEDPFKAALAGGIAPMVAETAAEAFRDIVEPPSAADVGRFAATATAFLTGQDIAVAQSAANNAVENNFLNSGKKKLNNEENSQADNEASELLNPHDVTVLQLVRENNREDFIDIMVKLERPDSPPSPRIKQKYEKRYETIRLSDVSAFNGQARFERLANLSFDELKAERLSERDPSRKLSPRSLQKMEKIILNEYDFLQGQKATLAIGAVAGIASLRSVGRSPLPQSTSRSANANAASSASSTCKEKLETVVGKGAKTTNQNMPGADYSAPGAEYSLRIDPITQKGPMAIDSRAFTNGEITANGGIRNQKQFWKMFEEKYPGMLSTKNLEFISKNKSPYVDSLWIQHFPEHQNYLGQTIEHHHLEQGKLAVPLPERLHRKDGNYSEWH